MDYEATLETATSRERVWGVAEVEPGVSFTWRSASLGVITTAFHRISTSGSGHVALTLGIHQSGLLAGVVALLGEPRPSATCR